MYVGTRSERRKVIHTHVCVGGRRERPSLAGKRGQLDARLSQMHGSMHSLHERRMHAEAERRGGQEERERNGCIVRRNCNRMHARAVRLRQSTPALPTLVLPFVYSCLRVRTCACVSASFLSTSQQLRLLLSTRASIRLITRQQQQQWWWCSSGCRAMTLADEQAMLE